MATLLESLHHLMLDSFTLRRYTGQLDGSGNKIYGDPEVIQPCRIEKKPEVDWDPTGQEVVRRMKIYLGVYQGISTEDEITVDGDTPKIIGVDLSKDRSGNFVEVIRA